MLAVQIHQIDYILNSSGPLDLSQHPRIPVLRIYGQSSVGLRTCIHVHQVYPYCYIDYPGKLHPRHVKRYIANLKQSLNHAIALSLKRDPTSKSHYVRAIFLVKGVKFYGFHSRYSPFLKVVLLDPRLTSRVAAILQSGSVLSNRFQVYESHLSFILQFLCDFGLYGCGSIEFSKAYRRMGSEEEEEPADLDTKVTFEPSPYSRQTRMPLELDITGPLILNRVQLVERKLHHSLALPGPERPTEPLVISVRELWEDERNRRRARGLDPTPEIPNDPSEFSRKPNNGWVSEAHWWDELRGRLEREQTLKESDMTNDVSKWENQVMSVFESTEALWEAQYRTWKPSGEKGDGDAEANIAQDINGLALSMFEDSGEAGEVDVNEAILAAEATDYHFDAAGEPESDEDESDESDDEVGEEKEGAEEVDENHSEEIVETSENGETHVDKPRLPVILGPSDQECSKVRFLPEIFITHSQLLITSIIVKMKEVKRMGKLGSESYFNFGLPVRKLIHFCENSRSEFTLVLGPDSRAPASSPTMHSTLATVQTSFQPIKILQRRMSSGRNCFAYSRAPPGKLELSGILHNIETQIYRTPFYSDEADISENPREFAGLVYHLKGGKGIAPLDTFATTSKVPSAQGSQSEIRFEQYSGWEYAASPPSKRSVRRWIQQDKKTGARSLRQKVLRSQIEGPTQFNVYGFKSSPLEHAVKSSRDKQNMTIMCLEVFAPAPEKSVPDPETDSICVAVYGLQLAGTEEIHTGIIAIQNVQLNPKRIRDFYLDIVDTELDLINRISDIVGEFDPDILIGWEVQRASWGYLNFRARQYEFDLQDFLSRAPAQRTGGDDRWGSQTASSLKVAGRHVLNAWRIMRSEQALTSYSLSSVAFHVLQQRIPFYSTATLSTWYDSPVPSHMVSLLRYLITYVVVTLRILEEAEIVTKTAEFARIFGVDFYSVISRGSQFKVESFMFRIAKPENFVLLSPSKNDVGRQNAAECMPLIMEPMSAFYSSPLVVLDFQSLYPSVMIAYNYCYSTCLGRVTPFQGQYKFGVTKLDLPPLILKTLKEHITIAPNGIMYAKRYIRKGLLGRMLIELLDTRVMVKQSMKAVKSDKTLTRILNARQLALKYIANVTYGYTSATYSGRMPAVEIADSIVQTGRETLEKAIDMINENEKWGAKVVYGDTDSLFIYLPGKTREQAFRIGTEIADTVTSQNPAPVKLKFEKVYHPCVLMAKKRYVGFKYENPDEQEPVFDAKGIETVRRDGVLAQRKLVENCLKILFRTQDLSQVKDYCCRSWYKMLENKVPIHDFIFAKEVRLGTYSSRGPPPPGVVVAARKMIIDPNNEPQYGERVPYVVIRGEPGTLLTERAMDPLDMINESHLQLDANYYITRVLIPPLERIFNLVGADVRQWFAEMPKGKNATRQTLLASPSKRKKLAIEDEELPGSPGKQWDIEEHLENNQCLVCGEPAFAASIDICYECFLSGQSSMSVLGAKSCGFDRRMLTVHNVCASCAATAPGEPVKCISLDCPWLYARKRAEDRMELVETIDIIVEELGQDRSRRPSTSSEEMSESKTADI
ncbi:DNA polymerase zeta catalytic subunit [Leucoagaricus sp. SymC.cos]|nr:DNA polymerase zeta catalytic subunit [Leucoagaricus sp. SymC.cos]